MEFETHDPLNPTWVICLWIFFTELGGKILIHSVEMTQNRDNKLIHPYCLMQDNVDVSWSVICQCVVNRHLSLWGEFIRPLFLTRVQVSVLQQA